jgi:hypothetical protein
MSMKLFDWQRLHSLFCSIFYQIVRRIQFECAAPCCALMGARLTAPPQKCSSTDDHIHIFALETPIISMRPSQYRHTLKIMSRCASPLKDAGL